MRRASLPKPKNGKSSERIDTAPNSLNGNNLLIASQVLLDHNSHNMPVSAECAFSGQEMSLLNGRSTKKENKKWA